MRLRARARLLRSNILKLKPHQAKAQNRTVLVRFLLYSTGRCASLQRDAKGLEAMSKVFRKRVKGNDIQVQKPLRCRMCGIREGIPTLQMAEVRDLTLRGALVEHHGMFQAGSPCFLQLGFNDDLSTIRCRIAHTRASSKGSDGGQYYQTILEFRDLTPAAEHILKTLIQSLWAHTSSAGGGP